MLKIVVYLKNRLEIARLTKERNSLFLEYVQKSWLWAMSNHSRLRYYEEEIDKLTQKLKDLGVTKFKYDFNKDENGAYLYNK